MYPHSEVAASPARSSRSRRSPLAARRSPLEMSKGRTALVVGLLVKVLELWCVCVCVCVCVSVPDGHDRDMFSGARTEVGALPDIQNDWSMRRSSGSFLLNLGNNADAQGAGRLFACRCGILFTCAGRWLAICGPRLTSLPPVLVRVQERDHT